MSIITGGKDEEADTENTSSKINASGVSEDSETESDGSTPKSESAVSNSVPDESGTGSALSESQIEELRKEAERRLQEQQKPLAEKLKEKLTAVRSSIRTNVMNVKPYIVEITLGSIVVLLVLGLFMLLLRENDFTGALLSTAVYLFCMCSLQCASLLHLPALMDPNRCSIFLSYSVCFLWGLGVDALLYLLVRWWRRKWLNTIASILAVTIAAVTVLSHDLIRKPIEVGSLEDNGAITCVTNILKENKDFTWTICSANDELRMTEFYGYHYETITFLRELQDLTRNPEIIIPTQNVYFFVEKIPINYAGSTNHEEVTVEGAEAPVPAAAGIGPYIAENRWYTMCHMYYWAQKFKELYPDEMEVYYETESFIFYRIQQNVNRPYNLAIDYGYNNPMPKTGNEEE